jgi:uncharacterized protein involved in response to NO
MHRGPFAYAFRTFFLAVAVSGLVLVPWWGAAVCCGLSAPAAWPANLWHGHEMLHGFVVAAIAGFLLTAVPSWTGQRGFAGAPLVMLAAAWLLGRTAVAVAAHLPAWLVAVADLSFLLLLAAVLAPPLVRERNRNTPLLAVLTALWAGNLMFHVATARGEPALASAALLATVNLVLVLVTVIGGRITPSFTATALRMRGDPNVVRASKWTTPLAVGVMVLVTIVDLAAAGSRVAGAIALVAAVVQAARLAQWQGHRTRREPLLWVLHAAYLCIPVGLLLKALALLGFVGWAGGWLHVLTVGAIALMILGVMTRVSLGHTGRALVLPRGIATAYVLLAVTAAVRAAGPAQTLVEYRVTVALAAGLWSLAFGLFLWRYAVILWQPRPDGRSG